MLSAYGFSPIQLNGFLTNSFHSFFPTFLLLHFNYDSFTASIFFQEDSWDHFHFPTLEWKEITNIHSLHLRDTSLRGLCLAEFQFIKIESDYYQLWTDLESIKSVSSLSSSSHHIRHFQFPLFDRPDKFTIMTLLYHYHGFYHWFVTDTSTTREYSVLLSINPSLENKKGYCWMCRSNVPFLSIGFIKHDSNKDFPIFHLCKDCGLRLFHPLCIFETTLL